MDDKRNAAVFAAQLFMSTELIDEKITLHEELRKHDESAEGVQRKAEIETRLKEIKAEEDKVYEKREAFHEALDRMIDVLAPLA